METKHTPGPWVADGSETTMATWVSGPDGKHICSMRKCEQDWSNARLIAAAPELLEALKAMVAIWEGPRELAALRFAKSVIDARAAIAKATGE